MISPLRRHTLGSLKVRCLATAVLAFWAAGEEPRAQARESTGAGPSRDSDLIMTLGAGATSDVDFYAADDTNEGDYLSNLGLDFLTSRRTERTDWSVRYRPFYTRYRQHGEWSTLNHGLDFSGGYDLSRRTSLTLSDHFSYSRNPLYVARYEAGDSPVLTRESKRWSNSSSADLDVDLSRSLTLQLGVSGAAHRFQESGLYDSNVTTGSAGVSKRVAPDETFSTAYVHSRYLLSTTGMPDLDTTSNGLRVGWSHEPGEGPRAGVSLGAVRIREEAGLQTFYTGDAFLRHSLRAWDFSVGYRQDLSADTGVKAVNLARAFYAGFSGRAGRSVRWGIVSDYGTRESRVVGGDQFDEGSVVDLKYVDVVVRGDLDLGPRWGLSGIAMGRRQDETGIPGQEITVRSLFLGITCRLF